MKTKPTWGGAVTCPDWCTADHSNLMYVEDVVHVERCGVVVTEYDMIAVDFHQPESQSPAFCVLHTRDDEMTAGEARRLITLLQAAASRVDEANSQPGPDSERETPRSAGAG